MPKIFHTDFGQDLSIGLRRFTQISVQLQGTRQSRYTAYQKMRWELEIKLTKLIDETYEHLNGLCPEHPAIRQRYKIWQWLIELAVHGDLFLEKLYDDNNKLLGLVVMPAFTMYRIETTKGKVLEYQQGREGPDYKAISQFPIETATSKQLSGDGYVIRFRPDEIVHVRLAQFKKDFYPYGVSLMEIPHEQWDEQQKKDLTQVLVNSFDEI